jgi:hypothetical protein
VFCFVFMTGQKMKFVLDQWVIDAARFLGKPLSGADFRGKRGCGLGFPT